MADKKKKLGQPTPQQHRNNVRTTEKYNKNGKFVPKI
jgi:hypothetical protein